MPTSLQLELIPWQNPLVDRLTPDFFRELPAAPGVYRWLSREAQVLYVGSSRNLRDRVGSYRSIHPARHSRRLCRLVQESAAIHIELTETEAGARALEASWIRHHRPRFNRALNRPAFTIFLGAAWKSGQLHTRWTDRPETAGEWPEDVVRQGPFDSRQPLRWLTSVRRVLWWTHQVRPDFRDLPASLRPAHPPAREWVQPSTAIAVPWEQAAELIAMASARAHDLAQLPWNGPLLESWEHDRETLAEKPVWLATRV